MRIIPVILLVILAGCSGNRMIETNLYFGQSKPNGGNVSAAEWKQFTVNDISRVFKEGSTIIPVSGNWMDTESHVLITEPTYLVVYFYKSSRRISRSIDSLRNVYKVKFQQQSVLRVDKKVKASF